MIRNYYKYYFVLIAASLILFAQGCDDTFTNSEVDNIVMPDSNVSYSAHIAPVFEVKCVQCHNDSRKEAGLDLSSWLAATNDPSIIFPGNDSSSVLVWTIERIYKPMPPSESLIPNHIKGIKTWIREGALNN